MSLEELILLYNRTATALKSTCQGFIEIYEIHDQSVLEYSQDYVPDEPSRDSYAALHWNYLSYTHRTVKEYFRKEGIRRKICLETRLLKDFSPALSAMIASTLLCKTLKPDVFIKYYCDKFSNYGYALAYDPILPRQSDHIIDLQYNHLLDQLHDLLYNIQRYNRTSLCNTDFVNTAPDAEAQIFEGLFFSQAMSQGGYQS